MSDVQNCIDGNFLASVSGQTIANINPANGQEIGTLPRSNADDVELAIAAAKKAQPAWGKLTVQARCEILDKIADGLQANLELLATLETEDTGKPISTTTNLDIPRAIRNFRFFADYARNEELPSHEMETGQNYTVRQPVGVVGLITPWNLPLYLLSWKVAPALAMGNAIVAKPSEMTPQTATKFAKIALDAGLPPGLLNIVHGYGPEAGQPILESPEVRAVSFTGGTATGKHVAVAAGPTFKKLSLELGGKNPGIVFADCDLEKTVDGIVRAGFTNQGQVCLCSSRILVEASIYDEFRSKLVAAVQQLQPGDPRNSETKLGALISADHREKVERYIENARRDGTVHCGGNRPDLPGAYLQATVIDGLPQNHPCVQEEIFGPVVTLQPFTEEAEAIALANGVQYGLAATVWSTDREKAKRVAEALETGMVWINDWLVRDLRVPFGGVKASGIGREGGRYSLDFYSEVRNIYVAN